MLQTESKNYDNNYLMHLKQHLRRGDVAEIAKRANTTLYYASQVLSGNRGREVKSETGLRIIEEAKNIIVTRITLSIVTGAKLNYSILNNFN